MASQTKFTTKLQGARVLVIGGSSGIEYVVAEAALEHGAAVTVSSPDAGRVDSTVTKLKKSYPSATVNGYACNLGDRKYAEKNIQALFQHVGKLDHVVCTAGDALAMVPIHDVTAEKMVEAGQARFFAPLLVAKHAAQYVTRSPKPSVTFTGDIVSDRPMPGWTLVSAFAAGIEGIARGVAIELKPVPVNVVRPGVVDTNLYAASGIPDQMKQGILAHASQKLPVQTVGTP